MKKFALCLAALAVLAVAAAPVWAWGACPLGGAGACVPPMPGSGSKIAHLLLSLAAGYGVLALAAKQARRLSIVGLVIGWFIVFVSASGLICVAAKRLCGRCHDRAAASAVCPYMDGPAANAGDAARSEDTESAPAKGASGAPSTATTVKKK